MLLKQQAVVRQINYSSVPTFSTRSNTVVGLPGCRSKQTKADRPSAHLLRPFTSPSGNAKGRRWKVLRFSRRIDLAGFNVNVDRLRNHASLTSGWVMPINFTCDKPSQNRQKARQLTLARADYSFFISAPVLTPLILFLYLLSLGHPAFVSLLPR